MSEFRLTIGIPASGKSTAAQRWQDEEGFIVVSSDDLRKELTGSAEDFSHEEVVWVTACLRVGMILHRRDDVVLDATNLIPEHRQQWVELAMLYGISPIAYRFPIERHEARARNLARKRVVPDHVMDRMFQNWNDYCGQDRLEAEGFVVAQ